MVKQPGSAPGKCEFESRRLHQVPFKAHTMSQNPLTFDVSALDKAPTGNSLQYSFDAPINMEGIKAKSQLKGRVELMRIEEGINAAFTDLQLTVELQCDRCLKPYDYKISVPQAERQLLFELPEKIEDPEDTFLVDKKHLKVDLENPIRQELILHFPVISVCYTGCKGVCPQCGKDRNQEICACKEENPLENKPLAALKDLIK